MATIASVKEKVTAISEAVGAVDTKLDEVKDAIQALRDQVAGGGVISQEDLDALDAQLDGVKIQAASVKSEADALVVVPAPSETIPVVDGKVDVGNITPAAPVLDGKSDTATNADLVVGTELEEAAKAKDGE